MLLQRIILLGFVVYGSNALAAGDAGSCYQELKAETNRLTVNKTYLLTKFDSVEDTADYMNAMIRGVCRKHCQEAMLPNGERVDCFSTDNSFVEGQRIVGVVEAVPQPTNRKLVKASRMPASSY